MKRGISAIVATVLLILVTVAAVVIIYAGILPLFNSINEIEFSTNDFGISLEGYTIYDEETGYVFIQIYRGGDELELIGLEIILDSEGNSATYKIQKEEVLGSNEKKIYAINFSNSGLKGKPESAKVVPIFLQEGKEIKGSVSSKIILPKGTLDLERNLDLKREGNSRIPEGLTGDSCNHFCECIKFGGVYDGSRCLGQEMVLNGKFLEQSDHWEVLGDASINIGYVEILGCGEDSCQGIVRQVITTVAGKRYLINYKLSLSSCVISGHVSLGSVLGNVLESRVDAERDSVEELVAIENNAYLNLHGDLANCGNPQRSFNEISVREVIDL